MTGLSVVVPTFNRGSKLRTTVERLLENRLDCIGPTEIYVVDDGSVVPADAALGALGVPDHIRLQVIRQVNGGPARARNTGFRASSGDIVLFIDDDILPAPDLLQRHVDAHRERQGCVIYGSCPCASPSSPGAVFSLLQRLAERVPPGGAKYEPVTIVASGQLSVERSMFDRTEGVYRDDLTTPGAEEYELSSRLRRRRIPILFAQALVAIHDAPTALLDSCRQQYKHGLGCGEAARRCPETLDLSELAQIVDAVTPKATDGLAGIAWKHLKTLVATRPTRTVVLAIARALERRAPQVLALTPLYELAIALHFTAGVRDGLSRFSESGR